MNELFTDISDDFKARARFIIDTARLHRSFTDAMVIIREFSNACTDREREFIDFYLKLKVEELV